MIRFGLLGCGRIAKRHSDLLGGSQIDGASLVAVCDPIRARAQWDALVATIERLGAHADLRTVMGRRAVQFTRNSLGHAAAMALMDDLVNAALARNR